MEKQAEETLLEQMKKTLGGYRDQVADFWNENMHSNALEQGLITGKNFLKDWAVPAGVTTLGAGALAGTLTAQGERPGETKRERTLRVLRNALIASGATGLGWAGAAGVAGLEPLTELESIADLTKERDERPIDTDISAGHFGEADDYVPDFSHGPASLGAAGAIIAANQPAALYANRAAKVDAAKLKPELEAYKKDLERYKKDRKTMKTVGPRYANSKGMYAGGKPTPKPSKPVGSLSGGRITKFIDGRPGRGGIFSAKRSLIPGLVGYYFGGVAPKLWDTQVNNSNE